MRITKTRNKTAAYDTVPAARGGARKKQSIPKVRKKTRCDQPEQTAQQIQLLKTRLRQARQHISALNAVATVLSESLDLNTVLNETIKKITGIFRFHATRIYLYNSTNDGLILRASFAIQPEVWSGVKSFRLGQGNVGRVAVTGKPLIFEDIQSDARYERRSVTKRSLGGGYRFFAAFPIKSKLKTVGIIVCVGKKKRRLDSSEYKLIRSIANQIGVAFENVSLFEQTNAKANELAALYSISTIINESLQLDVVLKKVMYRAIEIFDADAARIYLFDERENELRLLTRTGLPRTVTVPDSYNCGEGVTGRVFETGTPLFFDDTRNDPEFARIARGELLLRKSYPNQFYIPIGIKKKPIGVMNFLTKTPHHFTPSETHLIRTIANHLGMACENVRLFRRVEKQSRELSSLVKVNRDIASLLDRDTLLPRIAREAHKVLSVDAANFRLVENEELVLAGVSHPILSRLGQRLKLGESLVGTVAREKRVIQARNALADPRLLETHRKLYRRTLWRSYLGVPMLLGTRLIGVLCLVSKRERTFTPEDIAIIASFANQAALAIENANLFREIKNKVGELQSLNRKLRKANRVRSDFMAAMSHELRTPLTEIIGFTGLLRDGYGGSISETQRAALETVHHSSGVLLSLINNVLTLARTDAQKMPLEVSCAEPEETLGHVRIYAEHLIQAPEIKVSWEVDENLPLLSTDHGKLEQILQNLINNAYKFTARGEVKIRVRNLRKRKRIEFAVSDTGVGIAKADLKRAFEKFQQGPNAHLGKHSGMGLGLSIVNDFLSLMNGEIHVESRPGAGSTFRFTLPYSI